MLWSTLRGICQSQRRSQDKTKSRTTEPSLRRVKKWLRQKEIKRPVLPRVKQQREQGLSSRKNSCRFHYIKQMEADGKSNFNGVSACVILIWPEEARRHFGKYLCIICTRASTTAGGIACKVARSFFKNPTNKRK